VQAPKQTTRGRADTSFLTWHREVGREPFLNLRRASQRHALSRADGGKSSGKSILLSCVPGAGTGTTAGGSVMLGVPAVSPGGQRKSAALWGRTVWFLSLNERKENSSCYCYSCYFRVATISSTKCR